MTPEAFRHIYRELIDDNPLAVRAVLKILTTEFTTRVPTLAVTCAERPTLLVNLAFVSEHCRTDDEVRAVIVHEFLHVLLRHTEQFSAVTDAEHLALDAVINAIIHRTLGPAASRMMSRYYAHAEGAFVLLRPPTGDEALVNDAVTRRAVARTARRRRFARAWTGLYAGLLVADDIRDLAADLHTARVVPPLFIGSHQSEHAGRGAASSPDDADSPAARARAEITASAEAVLTTAIEQSLASMNGSGVFRSPHRCGVGATQYQASVRRSDAGVRRWRQTAYEVLRRHLLPDATSARSLAAADTWLPVLSPGDRCAALRATWSPFLPDAHWASQRLSPAGRAHVYLDASGSMDAELPLLVSVLARLAGHITRPFWAFSTVVAPARIEEGRLIADTTGGTSMRCVLEHVARHRPRAAVVVTDGYIEALSASDVAAVRATRLHILVTRDGTTVPFARMGLPYTQLGKVPQ